MPNILVYVLENKIYINLTNRCTNDCIFCLRNDKDDVCGQTLWLDSEDITSNDVIEQLERILSDSKSEGKTLSEEIVFCGYGEPMLKLDVMKEVCRYIKDKYPQKSIRVNTNGHANFVYKRNVVPELKGLVDLFSVSLNGENTEEYNKLSQPKFEGAYDEVKKFIKSCADEGIKVVASVVEGYKGQHLNLENCEKIAKNLGADFRAREWITNG